MFYYIPNNFVRKVNDTVKEKEPLIIHIYSSIYIESYIIQGLNFKNRVNHKDMKFLNDFFLKNVPLI